MVGLGLRRPGQIWTRVGRSPLDYLPGSTAATLFDSERTVIHGQEPAAPAFNRAAQAVTGAEFWPNLPEQAGEKAVGTHNPKPNIVVAIVWIVPVAGRTAHVVLIVVKRTAAHHTTTQPAPAKTDPVGSEIAILLGDCHWP